MGLRFRSHSRFRFLVGLWFGVLAVFSPAHWAEAAPKDFVEAKQIAERIYSTHPEDFYCGCRIDWKKGGRDPIDAASCGYRPRKSPVRARFVEWEHVVPASWFGQPMACWKKGGRSNCSGHDAKFSAMEADLHNLTPVVGEVNGDRGNLPYGVAGPNAVQYGRCSSRVDFETQRFEPRDVVKGDAARIVFYMMSRYSIPIDDEQLGVLREWAVKDPVDRWELDRDRRIRQQMGWPNPYVANAGTIALPELKGGASQRPAYQQPAALTPPPARSKVLGADSALATFLSGNQRSEVLGNKNSKLYHLTHCPGYSLIKPSNRVLFHSIAEAEKQGFRRAGNCP
ncbi:Putative endonuclease I [gamma proteobacterium HdN1]|nr:Putative endonuclease I [gamma proteobacterium HdN1]